MAGASEYIIDSFPVAICHNIRISRSRLLKGEKYRGYNASKRQYFYGVKVQLLTTGCGIPVEFCFCPGSEGDVAALSQLPLQLCPESRIYADSAYTDYGIEDLMAEEEQIGLMVQRRKNSLRPDKPWIVYLKQQMRKRIETSISSLTNLFPKKIHAVTPQGFLLKIVLFIAAFAFNQLL